VTYSQPQQNYRPNRSALWVNDRKTAANQPDYKGNVEITWELLQELNAAFNAGQYISDRGGQPCIKLDFALYAQQVSPGDKKPILSGGLSTVTETQRSAAARQQAAQGYAQAPQQQVAQQQVAAQGWPAHVPMPAGHAVPAQPQQPQPTYQQQAPQGYPAQPPAQAQAPLPVAPPAPAQPMPGAIHGQPPGGPAPQLPQNF